MNSSPVYPPHVLVIGSSDVCRAPLAASRLRQVLAQISWLSDAVVRSAGVFVDMDAPLCEVSAQYMAEANDRRLSQRLDREAVEGSSLILAMSLDERAGVSRAGLGVQRREFTLLEAVQLIRLIPERVSTDMIAAPHDLQSLVEAMNASRGLRLSSRKVHGRGSHRQGDDDTLSLVNGHSNSRRAHVAAVRAVVSGVNEFGSALSELPQPAALVSWQV